MGPAGSLLPVKSRTQSPAPRRWPALLFAAYFAIAWLLLIGVIVRPAQVSRLLPEELAKAIPVVVIAVAWRSTGGWWQETASHPVTATKTQETEQETVIRKKRKKPWWEE